MTVEKLIKKDCLYPVYQPVVSLENGDIYGYEALTRIDTAKLPAFEKQSKMEGISIEELSCNIENLFIIAEKQGVLWELEKHTRKSALKIAKAMGLRHKLFLNVSPDLIHAQGFKDGFTQKRLEKYRINPEDILFEITERTSIKDISGFKETLNHYKSQKFKIGIDDMGQAYSGLQLLCSINPDFIKIDLNIIRNINSDKIKQTLVKSLVEFCSTAGINLIAEGIETTGELETVIDLGVKYGQGFLIGKPARILGKPEPEACGIINRKRKEKPVKTEAKTNPTNSENNLTPSVSGSGHPIETLATEGITVSPETPATEVLNILHLHTDCQLIAVVDKDQKVLGVMPRNILFDFFGGQFGFSLNGKKKIKELMETEFLFADASEPVDITASKVTARDDSHLYTPVVITKKGKYIGIVTIKDLLYSIVSVEVTERTLEISRKNKQLQTQQIMAERDMKMAELVQKSFYPSKAPQTGKWDSAFIFRPMASVSGDVYDFYYDNFGELQGISLFDVSGHGVASGLVGILAKSISANTFLEQESKPLEELFAGLNEHLIREKGSVENYLTGLLIRVKDNEIEYVNGGHTDVFIRNKDGVSILGDQESKGHFLGIQDLPMECKTVKKELSPGDTLLLYTDCLIESRNLAGDEMGEDRLKDIFGKISDGSAGEMLDELDGIFEAFTEAVPLRDDLTILVLKYKG